MSTVSVSMWRRPDSAPEIVKQANQILKQLESENRQNGIAKPTAEIASSRGGMQLSFCQLDDPVLSQVRDEITVDINNLTPVEALNKLNEIRKIITTGNRTVCL